MAPASTAATGFFTRHRVGGLVVVLAAAWGAVAWAATSYLIYPGYLDHGEPNVALIAWRLLQGEPAYPAFDAPVRITNLYGPMLYLVHSVSYAMFGTGLWVGKVAGVVAPVLIPAAVCLSQRRLGGETALAAAILAAMFLLLGIPAILWTRSDSMIALLVALAVLIMNAAPPGRAGWFGDVAIGVLAGLAVGMKLHAGVYFVPIALFHGRERGVMALAAMAGAGAVTAAVPFTFEAFSLGNYLSWFPPMADKPISWNLAFKVLRYGAIYALPVAVFVAAERWGDDAPGRAEAVYLWAFVASAAALIPLAAKPGAGWYYLLPFLAVAIDLTMRLARRVTRNVAMFRAGIVAVAIAGFLVGIPIQKRFYRALHWDTAKALVAEIDAIARMHAGRTIEMGVGDNVTTYPRTTYKTLLVLAGHPYTIDGAIVTETSMLGIPLSDETVARMRRCATDIWLIPKGERPFEMVGYYGNPMFRPAFVEAFNAAYEKREQYTFFDVWACRDTT